MAEAAVSFLLDNLKDLLNSNISLIKGAKDEIENLEKDLLLFKAFLKDSAKKRNKDNDLLKEITRQISDLVYEAEDTIDTFVSQAAEKKTHNYFKKLPELFNNPANLLCVAKKVDSIRKRIKGMYEKNVFDFAAQQIHGEFDASNEEKKKIEDQPGNLFPVDRCVVSSRVRSEGNINKMVGLADEVKKIKDQVTRGTQFQVFTIVGMAGIGKTALATKVYNDTLKYFNWGAFITVGRPENSYVEILCGILNQIDSNLVDKKFGVEHQLAKKLYNFLMGKAYLIVLDDLWKTSTWEKFSQAFPRDSNGSRVIITTRLVEVADSAVSYRNTHHMRFMNVAESWDLLRKVVFAEEKFCPPEIEEIGKVIAHNCQGLPSEIIWVGELLSKAEKTVESWKKVQEIQNSVVINRDFASSSNNKILSSYNDLPGHLKSCFLYMGVFPHNSEIDASRLVKLWVAEGFIQDRVISGSLEDIAEQWLKKLFDRSLIIVLQRSCRGKIKTCKVHNVFRRLCVVEAEKMKFFHVINECTANSVPQGTKRLCIHDNIVFGIKNMHESMASVKNACSLLCTGATHHEYPLPVCLSFEQMKVLDLLTIRFYNFPVAILKLVMLRYLSLAFNGEIPASISRLGKLQTLIVRRNLRIKSAGIPSYLPMEIWNMKELRHLQFMGSDLPIPDYVSDQLSNLLTLSDVSAHSCEKRVLERVRNLKKLGIQIELVPSAGAAEPSSPFNHLALLDQLESFKCVVVNPSNLGSQLVKLPDSTSIFPLTLTKLTLSGCGIPWESMKVVGQLANLEVLKLKCQAFRGPEWVLDEMSFLKLKYLLLEDADLEHWKVSTSNFTRLEQLIVRHCYKLQKIPSRFTSLLKMEVVDCSPSAVDSAMQMQKRQQLIGNSLFKLQFQSSWNHQEKVLK